MIRYVPKTIEMITDSPGVMERPVWVRRMRGSVVVDYIYHGRLAAREWWVSGKKHREDGPAVVFYIDGRPHNEEWWQSGEMHRDHGPADIFYNQDGSVRREVWVRNGRDYTPSAHQCLAWAATRQKSPE